MAQARPPYEVAPNGCWLREKPYPQTKHLGKTRLLVAVLYERMTGQTCLPGTVFRHKCNEPRCINPAHVVPGTHGDNVADRVKAGRSAIGPRNGRAKLTEDDVRRIFLDGEPNYLLRAELGVDGKVIRDIRSGKTWRYLTSQLASRLPARLKVRSRKRVRPSGDAGSVGPPGCPDIDKQRTENADAIKEEFNHKATRCADNDPRLALHQS